MCVSKEPYIRKGRFPINGYISEIGLGERKKHKELIKLNISVVESMTNFMIFFHLQRSVSARRIATSQTDRPSLLYSLMANKNKAKSKTQAITIWYHCEIIAQQRSNHDSQRTLSIDNSNFAIVSLNYTLLVFHLLFFASHLFELLNGTHQAIEISSCFLVIVLPTPTHTPFFFFSSKSNHFWRGNRLLTAQFPS